MKKLIMFLCFAIAFGAAFAQNQGIKRVPAQKSDKSVPLTETQKVLISNLQKKTKHALLSNGEQQATNHEKTLTTQERFVIGTIQNTKKQPSPVRTKSTIFFENFETAPTDGTFPTGWTNVPTTGGNGWTTQPLSSGGNPIPGHSGTRFANILYHATVAHNAWVYTPSISLTAGTTYKISFWVYIQGYQGAFERMEVKIGTGTTSAAMTQLLFDNNNQDYATWTEITASYTPTATGTYYIGFHSYSPADVNVSMFDDVKVETMSANNLEIIANTFPYTQVPTSQILPSLSAKAKNIGSATQTNVTFSATLNGNPVGSSAPIASLASNVTSSVMTVTPTVNVASGNNTLVYSVAATATDEEPSNNTASFSFMGSDNVYAADQVTTFSNGVGNTSAISFGNIFEITSQTALTQVAVGFGTATSLNYSISLYSMTGDLAIAATPLFTQTAVRNAIGLATVNVPATTLAPGKYFLCIDQLTATNISVSYDSVATKVLYIKNGNNLTEQPGFGAVAIRMVVGSPNAPAAPTAFTATPDAGGALSCVLDWTNPAVNIGGTTLSDITSIVIQRDGTIIHTITSPTPVVGATNQTWTDITATNGLHTYTIYATNASGMGAAISQTVYVGIDPCTIAINTFPWTEGFEAGVIPDCWAQQQITDTKDWTVKTGNGASTGITTAHTGTKNLSYYNNSSTATVTKLILPKMDISSLANPVLRFWHGQQEWEGDQDELKVYYKTSATGNWTLAQTYTNNIPDWTQDVILLPNKSNDYYIAFEGTGNYGKGIVIDDIQVLDFTNVIDASVVAITQPVSGANLTNAEVVKVTVKNNGSDAITSLPLKLVVNGTEVATETITVPISSMTEYAYTFTATADLSAVQAHNIKVYTELPNDGNRANDTVLKSVINYGNIAVMGSVASITSCDIRFVDDGVDQNYSATAGDQMITFLPSNTGDRVKITFNELATTIDPYLGDYGYYDALFVLNGAFTNVEEVTDEDVLAAFAGDYTDNLPAPIISESTDGALTFYFSKGNMFGEPSSGWDANISCITPLAKDAGVTSIISPAETSGATVTVKVKVKNFGGDPITSMNVAYILNNNDPVVHAYTGNIIGAQSAEIEFTAPINLPTYGTYDLKVYTDLTGDMDRSNDTMKTTFAYKAPVKLYAYRTFDIDENDMGFVSFMSNSPETVTLESVYEDGDNSVRGGEFFNNELYVYTASGSPAVPANFIKMTSNWSSISTTTTTGVPNDVAYDYTTSTMFAAAGPNLYTINMQTGEFTTITSSMTANILTLACSHDGRLYAVSTAGDFYSVNKTDGELTLVGATGFVPNYIQSMAFDHNTGRLFWAFLKATSASDAASYLLEIDPATGKAVNLGNLGASATEMLMLYTPYDGIGINTVSLPNSNIKIYPNPVTDKVIIENAAGTTAKIFDVSGKVLLEAKIQKDKEPINLNRLTPGVYFIDLNGKDVKTTSKLIKK